MDNNYKTLLKKEVEEFREYGHKFLAGEISTADFKKLSGGMGSYAQRGGDKFMIRLRTPSGVITTEHINLILSYAKKYNLNEIHLTTRQAVQLHNLSIDDVCDIMLDGIDNNLFTRGGGGNFPRNVSCSPLSGVDPKEAFDVTPYALMVGDYLLDNATSYKLPRKVKIAFSSSDEDTACASFNDLGFLAVIEDGKPYFKLFIAGGMGREPGVGIPYDELVKPEEVLYYVEAIIQLFKAEGDYENKSKARIRFIPRRMGTKEFIDCFKKHLNNVKSNNKFQEISPSICDVKNIDTKLNTNILIAQKQEGLYTVILHPICGQMMTNDLEKICNFINNKNNIQIRLSMNEEMYIRNLTLDDANELIKLTNSNMVDTNIEMSVSCIGVPTCQMGMLQSQELYKNIIRAANEANIDKNIIPSIFISGCPNSCSRHQMAQIGFAGRKKKTANGVEDAFELFLGGKHSKYGATMGESVGIITSKEIPEFIIELCKYIKNQNIKFQDLLDNNRNIFNKLVEKYI